MHTMDQQQQQSNSGIKTKKEVVYGVAFLATLIFSIFALNFVSPFDYRQLSRIGLLSKKEKQDCDCQYAYGRWVRDESYWKIQQWYDESSPFLDPGFRCRHSGRSDFEFLSWKLHI